MIRKSAIVSISKTKLSRIEKKILKKYKPWGIILFSRNIVNSNQLIKLTQEIRKLMSDKKYPIMIDEEGGTVTRLADIIENSYSQFFFGKIYEKNMNIGKKLYINYLGSLIKEIKSLGININTVPVLDKIYDKTHKFLKDRCYSNNVNTIKALGSICVSTYKKLKMGTVIKHIPGHGYANLDSHKILPSILLGGKKLIRNDFKCFKNSKSLFAMTAHVKYQKIDKKNCVTFSKKIISEIIRKKIGFKGILMSDDLSMKALGHDLVTNAKRSLDAGCNLVLYCKGNSKESIKILKNVPNIDYFTKKKTSQFYKLLS